MGLHPGAERIAFLGDWLTPVGVSAEAWAKRHGIEPVAGPCQECGAPKVATIPFQGADGIRGLKSAPCEACGDKSPTPYCMVRDPRFGELLSPREPRRRKSNGSASVASIRGPR